MAQTKYPAVLEGHAVLPALTLVPPPADAPEQLQISGRYAGPPGQRVDTPESVPGISALSDKAAPRPTGISLPLKGQPVQGLSGIKNMKDGTFLTLTDNGFGSKANSPDAMLMFHVVKPDWKSGAVERVSTTFLSDPDRKVPFRIVNENTAKRYLTGSGLRHRIDPADRRRTVVRRRVRAVPDQDRQERQGAAGVRDRGRRQAGAFARPSGDGDAGRPRRR